MGLFIEKPTNYGVGATYWNIHNIHYSKKDKSVTVRLAGYADYKASQEDKEALVFVETNLRGENLPIVADGISFTRIYDLIKSTDEWRDSKNDPLTIT